MLNNLGSGSQGRVCRTNGCSFREVKEIVKDSFYIMGGGRNGPNLPYVLLPYLGLEDHLSGAFFLIKLGGVRAILVSFTNSHPTHTVEYCLRERHCAILCLSTFLLPEQTHAGPFFGF